MLLCEASTFLLVVVTLMRYDIQFVTQIFQKREEKNANPQSVSFSFEFFSFLKLKYYAIFLHFVPPSNQPSPCNVSPAPPALWILFFFYRKIGKKTQRCGCVLIRNLSSISEAVVDVSPAEREGRVSHSCAELFLVRQFASLNIFWIVWIKLIKVPSRKQPGVIVLGHLCF